MQKQSTEADKELTPTGFGEEFDSLFLNWIAFRKGLGKKPKDWNAMFEAQLKWLKTQPASDLCEILSQSMRNGWQGLFEVKRNGNNGTSANMSAFEITKRIEAIEERLGKTVFDKEKHKDEREQLFARRRELKALLRS